MAVNEGSYQSIWQCVVWMVQHLELKWGVWEGVGGTVLCACVMQLYVIG